MSEKVLKARLTTPNHETSPYVEPYIGVLGTILRVDKSCSGRFVLFLKHDDDLDMKVWQRTFKDGKRYFDDEVKLEDCNYGDLWEMYNRSLPD